MKKNKSILIGAIISLSVIFGGIGTFMYFKSKKASSEGGYSKKGSSENGTNSEPTNEEMGSNEKVPSDSVLKLGSVGVKVAYLQMILNYLYGAKLSIDGKFGESTRKALREYTNYYCIGTNFDCKIEDVDYKKWLSDARKKGGSKKGWTDYVNSNTDYKRVLSKYTTISIE